MRAPFPFLAYSVGFRRLLFPELFGGRLEKCSRCVGSLRMRTLKSRVSICSIHSENAIASIAKCGLHFQGMSSDKSTYMAYNNTTCFAILDMPLAQTPQFTMRCGLHWQVAILNQQKTCPLITVHMLCAQKTSFDNSPRFAKIFTEKI